MAALILLQKVFNGKDISERGINMTACRKVYNFKPFDITNVNDEVSTRVLLFQAGQAGLALEKYSETKHRKVVEASWRGGVPEAEVALDTPGAELRFLAQTMTFDHLHELDAEGLAKLAVRLKAFHSKKEALALPVEALRQLCLVKLNLPLEKPVAPGNPEGVPATMTVAEIDALLEKDADELLVLLKKAGWYANAITLSGIGGKKGLRASALKAFKLTAPEG